jgi:uncharacterized protein YcnI
MRSNAWSSLATSACKGKARPTAPALAAFAAGVALVCAAPARAHVGATPAFVPAGGADSVSLSVHNDRPVVMDGFAVAVPRGLRIEDVGTVAGWRGSFDAKTATWTAGSLPSGEAATFSVSVEATPDPGTVTLRAEQRYPDGEAVEWPVTLTIVPADGSSGDVWVYAVLGLGVLLATAGIVLVWQRREVRR